MSGNFKIPRSWGPPTEDFTVYRKNDDAGFIGAFQKVLSAKRIPGQKKNANPEASKRDIFAQLSKPLRFDDPVQFRWNLKVPETVKLTKNGQIVEHLSAIYQARSLICSCFDRKWLSITLRIDKDPLAFSDEKAPDSYDPISAPMVFGQLAAALDQVVSYSELATDQHPVLNAFIGTIGSNEHLPYHGSDKDNDEKFLFGIPQVANVLFQAIFQPECEIAPSTSSKRVIKHGLVIISGQTGTAKSQLLSALTNQYLLNFNHDAWGKKRRPHVLTLEDPIERPLRKNPNYEPEPADGFTRTDYTPRQIGRDVANLKRGLEEALRQTPAVVVVGETRKRENWQSLLEFASTGHLCITTTHAGSLVETVRTLIEATRAFTPDLRSSLMEKLVAVVHLKSFDLTTPWSEGVEKSGRTLSKFDSMLVPAVWRNVNGANFFVSDGLSAILPGSARAGSGNPNAARTQSPPNCRGRAYFVKKLLSALTISEEVSDHASLIAMRADLEGV